MTWAASNLNWNTHWTLRILNDLALPANPILVTTHAVLGSLRGAVAAACQLLLRSVPRHWSSSRSSTPSTGLWTIRARGQRLALPMGHSHACRTPDFRLTAIVRNLMPAYQIAVWLVPFPPNCGVTLHEYALSMIKVFAVTDESQKQVIVQDVSNHSWQCKVISSVTTAALIWIRFYWTASLHGSSLLVRKAGALCPKYC